ncbi:unannotated protein [freshwater metagenome]|uniref:Unannotated protein n=1 Tax=freshwater metagenome TaxID=449393 RepID=A0A6J6W3B5_9ZZZZ
MIQRTNHREVFATGEVFINTGILTSQSDNAPDLIGMLGHINATDFSQACIGLQERGKNSNRGGLACTVRSQKAKHAALRNLQINPIERSDRAVPLDEPLGSDRLSHCDLPT